MEIFGTLPEMVRGKCARSTNVDMRDNTISSSTLRVSVYYRLIKIGYKVYSSVLVSSTESITLIERVYRCMNTHASQL